MEIFNSHFVSAVMHCLLKETVNGGSVTRSGLCDKLGIGQEYVPVIAVITDSPEFVLFESVKRIGYRRVKAASGPVAEPEPELTTASSEQEPEPVTAPPVAATEPEPEPATDHGGKPELKILDTDSNAFSLIAKAAKVAKKSGMNWDAILGEMTSGDYNNLLATLQKHFVVC